jgi:hypothetical protein
MNIFYTTFFAGLLKFEGKKRRNEGNKETIKHEKTNYLNRQRNNG